MVSLPVTTLVKTFNRANSKNIYDFTLYYIWKDMACILLLILPKPVKLDHYKYGRKSHSSALLSPICRAILSSVFTNPDLHSPELQTEPQYLS